MPNIASESRSLRVDRRRFLTAAALGAAVWSCGRSNNSQPPPKRPNIIFLFPEQMRGVAMGCMGDPNVKTPNLDKLAAEGLLLRNTFANTPVCRPARAIILTGKYTHANGMLANDLRLRESETTLAEILAQAGYRTGFIGKWHLDGGPRLAGFVPPGPRRQGFEFWAANEFSHKHFDTHYFRDSDEPIPIKTFEPEIWADLAVEFLNGSQDGQQPFFLTVQIGSISTNSISACWKASTQPESFSSRTQSSTAPWFCAWRSEISTPPGVMSSGCGHSDNSPRRQLSRAGTGQPHYRKSGDCASAHSPRLPVAYFCFFCSFCSSSIRCLSRRSISSSCPSSNALIWTRHFLESGEQGLLRLPSGLGFQTFLPHQITKRPDVNVPTAVGAWIEQLQAGVTVATYRHDAGVGEVIGAVEQAGREDHEAPDRLEVVTHGRHFDLEVSASRRQHYIAPPTALEDIALGVVYRDIPRSGIDAARVVDARNKNIQFGKSHFNISSMSSDSWRPMAPYPAARRTARPPERLRRP